MSVVKECFVLNLQVGIWTGARLDKKLTKRVSEDASAHPDAIRVSKYLVTKESLATVAGIAGQIRTHFYTKTLPWKDNGDRLLTRKLSMIFLDEHAEMVRQFDQAALEFIERRYAVERERADFRMGLLFDERDYPEPERLRKRFYVNLDIDEVAQAKDVRLQDDMSIIQSRVTKAVGGLWEKLADPLKHFATTMAEDDKVFRNTTVSNLRDIVAMIPELNFADDPNLNKIKEDIEKRLTVWDPDDLRKNIDARKAVAAEAQGILDEMAGFMTAFGVNNDD